MSLSGDRRVPMRDAVDRRFPTAAAQTIYVGSITCINASGLAVKATTATGLKCVGISKDQIVNSTTEDYVSTRRGTFPFKNSASGDAVTLADIGSDCYIVDDETVAKTNGSNTRSICGKVFDVNEDGVYVTI